MQRCEARAACFLDLKRTYMENLDLAAFYTANYEGSEAFICDRFGFEALPELAYEAGPDRVVTTAVLDFGPGVMHWLGRLVEAQWTRAHDGSGPRAFFLCRLGRELWVEGERKALTRLEYGVLDHLERNAGAVASREELLGSVWGQAHTGSNVVDVVVRSIRKKLGVHASAIQTVTGHGYRMRAE